MRFLIVVLILLLPAAGYCGQKNLLANGGFECGDGGINGDEQGVGRGWETICGGAHPEIYQLDPQVKHSGRFSQRMTCTGYNYKYQENGGFCYHIDKGNEVRHPCATELGLQAVAQTTGPGQVRPGATYECSVWVKIEGLTDEWEWFRLSLYWLDSSGKFIAEVREDHETSKSNYGSHDWKLIKISARAPDNAAFAKVYLHHHFVHGTVWYDDACLEQVGP